MNIKAIAATVALIGGTVGVVGVGAPMLATSAREHAVSVSSCPAGDVWDIDMQLCAPVGVDVPAGLPACQYEDGNTDGLPCVWTSPRGVAYWVSSDAYGRTVCDLIVDAAGDAYAVDCGAYDAAPVPVPVQRGGNK